MSGYSVVYFKAVERGFSVPSVLTEFSFFGLNLSVKWYGVIIAFGFLLAVLFGGRMAYKWKMNPDKMIDALIYGTIFGIISARLFYVVFHWADYKDSFPAVFHIWDGGLTVYGGLIGGFAAAYAVCRIRRLNFKNLLDIGAVSYLLGAGIGTWGNFTGQSGFGTNTAAPWGLWSAKIFQYLTAQQADLVKRGMSINAGSAIDKAYVHPIFLYESLWCLLGFAVLCLIYKKYRKFSGQLFLCGGVWLGAGQAAIESFRIDSLFFMSTGIRVSMVLFAAVALACAVLLAALLRKYNKNPKPMEGIDYFPEETANKKPGKKAEAQKDKSGQNAVERMIDTDGTPEEKGLIEEALDEASESLNNSPGDE